MLGVLIPSGSILLLKKQNIYFYTSDCPSESQEQNRQTEWKN